jgi:TolB-like protein
MSWGFDITPEGVRPISPAPKEPGALPTAGSQIASGAEASVPPSIAVLPFVDMSAEHDQQYLGDGIAEELLNALASIEGLNVAARTSSFSFAGRGASMNEIGDTLHVRHVLEGSVRRAGQKLRVTAQLIDVRSGFHLFTQSYDRQVQDIFDIQNDIAREIAGALLPKLGLSKDVTLIKQGTSNLEAYNLHLKGRQWLAAPNPETAEATIAQLRQAIALDPHYADAWADLSYMQGYLASWGADQVPLLVEASHSAATALSQSPTNVIALLMQAYVAMLAKRDAAAAASYYARARAAGGDVAFCGFEMAYCYYGPLGRFDEAIALLKEAERKDPLAPNVKHALIEMYLASGRVAEALACAEALLTYGSPGPGAMNIGARAFVAAGHTRRACEVLDAMTAAFGRDYPLTADLELFIAASRDDHATIHTLLDRLLMTHSAGQAVSAVLAGEAYRALGDYDQAINWWTRAVERYEAYTLVMAIRYRNDAVIGKDPRFLALLKRMGLESDAEEKGAAQ